jgi:hypothetical protein
MKKATSAIILALFTITANAQIKAEAMTQNILGRNVGYYVTLKNIGNKPVDGVKWTAYFYDNFDDLKGTRDGKWQSGNFMKPIKPGGKTQDLEYTWIKDATKVKIKITKVHSAK